MPVSLSTPKKIQQAHKEFTGKFVSAKSLIDAIYILRDILKPYGIDELLYAHMLHKKSFIRNDLIIYGTFDKTVRDTFAKYGGASAHVFGDFWPKLDQPYQFELKTFLLRHSEKYSTKVIIDKGFHDACIIPILPPCCIGYAGFMLFKNSQNKNPDFCGKTMMVYAKWFHELLKTRGLIAAHFQLSSKEVQTLDNIAKGKTTADITEILGVSSRTIEHRLAQCRKKLFAHTTAETVYKALAYGILS